MNWQIRQANIDTPELEKLLKVGWDPFAVSNQGVKVWLKKQIETRGRKPKPGKKNGD